MAEAYKKAKLINTSGAKNNFVGLQNVGASSVTISGPFIYGITGACGAVPISITLGAGQLVPVNCTSITPAGGNVIGFLA
jgi:hypothetical protein